MSVTQRLGISFRLLARGFKWIIGTIVVFAIFAYGISFIWPVYDWDLHVPSPDGHFDLVVLRGDAAAFDDFSYRIYLFPHTSMPRNRAKGTRVWLTPTWRGRKFLVYDGYNYPMFRWTSARTVEIDLTDLNIMPFTFEPVKIFGESNETVLVSVVFGKENKSNALP